ncbi:hypothetical protein WOSG25_021920 [Weissella oryzae SG25]|uniref:Uncharacterized protein n=1 Tax=Weissella oryzae (strain DSM 25784 / JCM 18191 / LMG 30913 / SG25) TaxID=1329250 RepID=A0A069CRK8_WEIOS|nr:MarR family transcriptional regulator [Weissella oryzae]GAK30395.1 hypothetical protein WOSG25_021920 [Weissella oryzae SG25]
MSDKGDWSEELGKAHIIQQNVADFLGISKSQMTTLVNKMVLADGKTASSLDKRRWQYALDYIELKQKEVLRKKKVEEV